MRTSDSKQKGLIWASSHLAKRLKNLNSDAVSCIPSTMVSDSSISLYSDFTFHNNPARATNGSDRRATTVACCSPASDSTGSSFRASTSSAKVIDLVSPPSSLSESYARCFTLTASLASWPYTGPSESPGFNSAEVIGNRLET